MVTAVYLRAPERESTNCVKRKHVREFFELLSLGIQFCEVCLCIHLYFTSTTCISSMVIQKTVDLKFRVQICHPEWVAVCSSFVLCVPLFIPQLAGQHPGSWHYHGVLALHGVQSCWAAGESGPAVVIFILMHCPYRLLCGPYSVCPGRSCSAASWWHFKLILCSKYTEPTVMTEIMHDRQGPALHVNSSLTTPLWNRALFYAVPL